MLKVSNFVLWCTQVTFIFNNNKVTDENGQGLAFYADSISQCTHLHTNDTSQIFERSVFSNADVFNFR